MINGVRNVIFQVKWFFMPMEARYAYLWSRTRASYENRISRGLY